MKRIKTVGLAAVAALALCLATGASAASAAEFRAEDYPASVSGSQVETLALSTHAGNVQCQTVDLSGTAAEASSSLELAATFGKCKAFGFLQASIDMNSCSYVLESTSDLPPLDGTLDLACGEEGDAIEIKAFTCTVTVPEQEDLDSLELENKGSGANREVEAVVDVGSIMHTTSAGCPGGGAGSFDNGSYSGAVLLDGASGEEQTGIYVDNEQVPSPSFRGEEYPLAIYGATSDAVLSTNAGTLDCGTVTFVAETGNATTELAANSSWSGCVAFGSLTYTVDMNSCVLTFGLEGGEDPYEGSLGVDCDEAGDSIVLTGFSCTIKFGSQGGEPIELGNSRSGGVEVEQAGGGLEYTTSSGCSGGKGSFSNGTLSGSWQVEGAGQEIWIQ